MKHCQKKRNCSFFDTMRFSKLMLFSEISLLLTCHMHHLSFGMTPFHAEIYTSTFFMSSAAFEIGPLYIFCCLIMNEQINERVMFGTHFFSQMT